MYKKAAAGRKNLRIAVFLAIILVLGVVLSKYSAISPTAKVVQDDENIFSERINLQLNKSGTYEWKVKNPGSIRSLKMTGSVSSNGTARVYIEKNGTRQLIFDSTKQLFDVNIHVLPEFKNVLQGGRILIQNELLNLHGFGSGSVNVRYAVKDLKGNLIAAQEETVFVETQAKFVRELVIPNEVKPGSYIAFVEAYANNTIVGTSSDSFEVSGQPGAEQPKWKNYAWAVGISGIAVLVFIIAAYLLRILIKRRKLARLNEIVQREQAGKLGKELAALEKGRKSGLISQKSYNKEKARIDAKLKTKRLK